MHSAVCRRVPANTREPNTTTQRTSIDRDTARLTSTTIVEILKYVI